VVWRGELQRSEKPGWRRGTAIPRRGGFARWDAAFGVGAEQGELSRWRVIPHSPLVMAFAKKAARPEPRSPSWLHYRKFLALCFIRGHRRHPRL